MDSILELDNSNSSIKTLSLNGFNSIISEGDVNKIKGVEKIFKILDTEHKGYLNKSNLVYFNDNSCNEILFDYFSEFNKKISIELFLNKLFNLNGNKDSINRLINLLVFFNKDLNNGDHLNFFEFESLLKFLEFNTASKNDDIDISLVANNNNKIEILTRNLNLNLNDEQLAKLGKMRSEDYFLVYSSLSKLKLLNDFIKDNIKSETSLSELKLNLKDHLNSDELNLLLSLTLKSTASSSISKNDFEIPLLQSQNKQHTSPHIKILESAYSFVLGSIAGCIGATIVYPIDLIKTRMQAQKNLSLYKNSMDCLIKTIQRENFKGLYSGLTAQLIGVAPEKAIKLTVNDLVRGLGTDKKTKQITPLWEILSGCSAGACQVLFTNPLEIVKIRLQMQGNLSTSIHKTMENKVETIKNKSAADIVKELGFRGLYKGSLACLLRDIPFSAIYFPTYANLKKYLFGYDPQFPKNHLSSWQLLISGALAGAPAAFLTTPFDVIKTRLQIKNSRYTSVSQTFKIILTEEGPKAFFKGSLARVLRSSPQFGFTLATYELFQNYIGFSKIFVDDGGLLSVTSSTTNAKMIGSGNDVRLNYMNKINQLNQSLINLNFGK